MKHTLTYSLQVILLSLLFLLPMSFSVQPVATIAQQPVTEIYIIRHAEKDTSNKADKDPNLSAAGKKRADALKKILKNVSLTIQSCKSAICSCVK